jgi:hypothetical protein
VRYLVLCDCGHALDRHGAAGCDGDGKGPCRCRKDAERALDSAIEGVRTQPWASASDTVKATF